MGWKENKIKRNMEYAKENIRQINLSLNKKTDVDIIEHLESIENVSGYIKQLIKNDIKETKK